MRLALTSSDRQFQTVRSIWALKSPIRLDVRQWPGVELRSGTQRRPGEAVLPVDFGYFLLAADATEVSFRWIIFTLFISWKTALVQVSRLPLGVAMSL
jgi:hypothetical protein